MRKKRKKPDFKYVDVPVVDGIATLPYGMRVRTTAQVVRVPMLTKRGAAKLAAFSLEFSKVIWQDG